MTVCRCGVNCTSEPAEAMPATADDASPDLPRQGESTAPAAEGGRTAGLPTVSGAGPGGWNDALLRQVLLLFRRSCSSTKPATKPLHRL